MDYLIIHVTYICGLLPTSLVMLVSILWMFLISKAMSSITEEKLTCLYPSPSSIQPCFCHMQAEFEAEDVKCSEDVKCDDDYDNAWAEKRTFSGTFYKTIACNLEDKSSFSKAAQGFHYDNRMYVLKISGKHDGDFFPDKERSWETECFLSRYRNCTFKWSENI